MSTTETPSERLSNRSHGGSDLLDVSLLKEFAKASLVEALNSVNGTKTLVLEPALAGPLGLVVDISLLKQHAVDKMFWLEAGPISSLASNVVYICRPKITWIKIIADQIKSLYNTGNPQKPNVTILLVPRTSTLVSRILEEEGVLGDVNIASYNLQFIPIAEDVISLEQEHAYREIWVDGDESMLYDSAQALITFQKMYGFAPRIIGKGDCAAKLANLLTRLAPRGATRSKLDLTPSDAIDSLVVLDRHVDMITPLLTQLTYEGLVDEMIGIQNSHVELPALPSNPGPSNAPLTKDKTKKYHLNASSDALLAEIRDMNYAHVPIRLNQVARQLSADYDKRSQAQTVSQLRDFVGQIKNLANEKELLSLHIKIADIMDPMTKTDQFGQILDIQQSDLDFLASYDVVNQLATIEELIAQGSDLQTVLRLLCLASLTSGGIKSKTLESLKREILQTYGHQHLPFLLALSSPSVAMLLPNPLPTNTMETLTAPKLPFSAIRKSLRLLTDDSETVDERDNDISYVYSGYAPISIRLVQCVAQKGGVISNPAEKEKGVAGSNSGKSPGSGGNKVRAHPIVGWKGFEDIVESIPGATIDVAQSAAATGGDMTASSVAASLLPHEQTTTTVVFFLGGCTYTEIAALRWASQQTKGRRFLVATTGIINGNTLLKSIAGQGRDGPVGKDASLSSQ